jgi:hypothetical protein
MISRKPRRIFTSSSLLSVMIASENRTERSTKMSKRILIGVGIALVLTVTLGVGGLFVTSALAQGPTTTPNGFPGHGAMHNNTAVLDLLKLNVQDLLKERQAGKSLLDIAKAKGIDEAKLTDALLQPIAAMHTWMERNDPQSNANQMTQYMRDWIAKDIRETQFGTMTDFRLGLGVNGGMLGGNGMMGNFNGTNGFGGMMGGWRR